MGVVNSCCIPRRSCDCGKTKRNGELKGPRRQLSATFNLSVREDGPGINSCLVDINSAAEEELMTLRGIDRTMAKNIIDHRNQIGGFRCVEDIALVSGVGAAKYVQIRDDIYIPPSPNSSPNSTKRSDGKNVVSSSDNDNKCSTPIVSVNTANVFSLIRVRGIGMTIAKNIVEYRDKYGKFNCVDELKKVKGIGPMLLESIKVWLTVDEKKLASDIQQSNGKVNSVGNGKKTGYHNSSTYERRSTSSIENLLEILGPLAKIPTRPSVKPVSLKHKNKKIFRLASWNLQKFSKEKASNPGVKDVVCMTILENRFGIVAVQELGDVDALQEICQELNTPTLPNVKGWKGRRGKWKCVVSKAAGRMFQSMEYHGFLYDESQNIQLVTSCLIESPSSSSQSQQRGTNKSFTRMPYLGVFKINDAFDCVVVSVHLKAPGFAGEDKKRTESETDKLGDVVEAIHKQIKDEEDIIILGDFNLGPDSNAFDDLRDNGYLPSISSDVCTNISHSNPDGSENYDNIWLSRQTRCLLAGNSGVIRQGLDSPWIPDGWSWGGVVSDHCPVYTQLYACTDMDKDGDVTLAREATFEV